MKRKVIAAALAAVTALAASGCAFEEMLGQLDSALESVSQADTSSAAEDESTDEKPDDHSGDKQHKPDSKSDSPVQESSSVQEESSSAAEPIGEVDETRFRANARAVISSWFDLMSAAQYTDAFKLCTEDFVQTYYPDGLTDGENASPASVSYYEGMEEFDTDEQGRSRIRLLISVLPNGDGDKAKDVYMYVVLSDGQFLISGTANTDGEGAAFMGELTQDDVELFARYVYDCTNIYIAMLEPGVYETGDGSELDRLIPEYTDGGHYVVTIGNEGVDQVIYTAEGLTAVYPQ